MTPDRRRIALSLAASALASAAAYPMFILAIGTITSGGNIKDLLNMARFGGIVFLVALVVASAHAVVLGLPAVLILRRENLMTFPALAFAGFVAGLVPMTLWAGARAELLQSSVAGLFGAIGGAAFWLVWRYTNR